MDKVYLLQHSYEIGKESEYDEVKLIGVFSSYEKAETVMYDFAKLPGFKDYPIKCFHIDEYTIDSTNWTEGFCSL